MRVSTRLDWGALGAAGRTGEGQRAERRRHEHRRMGVPSREVVTRRATGI